MPSTRNRTTPRCTPTRCLAFIRTKQYDRALADENHAQELVQQKHLPDATAGLLILRSNLDTHRRDYPAAVNDLQTSLKLNQKNELAWNNLAWLRATAPDASIRNGRESVRLAQKAVSLATKNTHADLDTLAAAYAEAGDYPQAIECEKRALDAASKEITDAALAGKFHQQATARLLLFAQHQPYHVDASKED